jgi:peptidoglycan hydrolase-like protein with peptidoglycan-binding domain
MKKIVRLLLAVVLVTAVSSTALISSAEAKTTYVSSTYSAPKKGQTSSSVKALQQRLVKAKALESKYVTSYFGPITEKAVKKFQKQVKLSQTGKVDKKTWTKLVDKTGKIKVTSSKPSKPAAKKTSYPAKGQTSAKVTELQSRLLKAKALSSKKYVTGYFGDVTTKAVKKFQKQVKLKQTGKVDKKTWDKLVAKTGKYTPPKPAKVKGIDKRCMVSGRALCIDKTKDKLYYMKAGKVIRTFDARFGCAATRTREGTFSVLWKSRNHVSTIYGSAMPYAMFFSGGQAVHYSSDFAARGYNGCSHGCVNIRNKSGLAWVFDQVRNGDRVVVYRS